MTSVLLFLAGLAGVVAGRFIMGRWYNHLSLYSAIWGVVLALMTVGLVHYYPLVPEARQQIALAWIQLFVGSLVAGAWIQNRQLVRQSRNLTDPPPVAPPLARLRLVIVVLTSAAAAALAFELIDVARASGSLGAAMLTRMTERYLERISGQSETVPYVGALAMTASALAGSYTAYTRRLGPVAIAPLATVVLNALLLAGRTGILIAAALFVTTLVLTPRDTAVTTSGAPPRRSSPVISLILVITLAGGGFMAVSASRGLVVDLPGIDPAMARISRAIPFMPSLYAHLSVGPPVLSEYIKAGAPRAFPGANTFAPAVRLASRFGIGAGRAHYEEMYFTPVAGNVGTWLKNLHADFGPAAAIWFPFLFGAGLTWLSSLLRRHGRFTTNMLLAHGMAVIALSFTYNIMVLGDWWISLVAGLATGLWLDRRSPAPASA